MSRSGLKVKESTLNSNCRLDAYGANRVNITNSFLPRDAPMKIRKKTQTRPHEQLISSRITEEAVIEGIIGLKEKAEDL